MDFALALELGFAIVALIGVLGAALVVGGAVAYRESTRTAVRVLAASAVAAGVAMWALILYITPVSVMRGG